MAGRTTIRPSGACPARAWHSSAITLVSLKFTAPGGTMKSLLMTLAIAATIVVGMPVFAQVQLDHNTAQALTDLGIDTAQVTDEGDVGYINQILASDSDEDTKKAEIMKLLEEN
jgi:hypothetical protein